MGRSTLVWPAVQPKESSAKALRVLEPKLANKESPVFQEWICLSVPATHGQWWNRPGMHGFGAKLSMDCHAQQPGTSVVDWGTISNRRSFSLPPQKETERKTDRRAEAEV